MSPKQLLSVPGSSSPLQVCLPVPLAALGMVTLIGKGKLSTTQTPHSAYGLILAALQSYPHVGTSSPIPTVDCGVCMQGWSWCLRRALPRRPAVLCSHAFSQGLASPFSLWAARPAALLSRQLICFFPSLP